MSVWSNVLTENAPLAGAEGALVIVSVAAEPSRLEQLLDALAHLDFPINPQIYHDAVQVYRFADDHEEAEPTTLVEFPAYQGRLPEIRAALESYGFPPDCVQATAMLEDLHSSLQPEPAPAGSSYQFRFRRRHAIS
ncbi:MAG: hypothetical protein U0Q18_06915 [Bryobacteraceae bacterium]